MQKLTLFFKSIQIALAGRMAYRGDFFITFIILLFMELIAPFITFIIYKSGASFPGWSMNEVLFLQGVFALSRGTAFTLFNGMIEKTVERVQEGTFDLILLKPQEAIFSSLLDGIYPENLGGLLGGIALMAFALSGLQAPEAAGWLQFGILFLLALVVLFSFSLIMSGTAFIWVGNYRVFEVMDSISQFGLYPVSIFSKTVQFIITTIIPIAMIGYFPAAAVLGKLTSSMAGPITVTICFFISAIIFWHKMLSKYTSAGG